MKKIVFLVLLTLFLGGCSTWSFYTATFSGYENANPNWNNEERFNQDIVNCWSLAADITSDTFDPDTNADATEENFTKIEVQNILFLECMWVKGWQEK